MQSWVVLAQSVLGGSPGDFHDYFSVAFGHFNPLIAEVEPNGRAIIFVFEPEMERAFLVLTRLRPTPFEAVLAEWEQALDVEEGDVVDVLWDRVGVGHGELIVVFRNVVEY